MWSWEASCVRCVKVVHNFHAAHTACFPAPHDHNQHKQANTTHSFTESCSPDDGHNDARNMLRVNLLWINISICGI